jgi:hypothetical protein
MKILSPQDTIQIELKARNTKTTPALITPWNALTDFCKKRAIAKLKITSLNSQFTSKNTCTRWRAGQEEAELNS